MERRKYSTVTTVKKLLLPWLFLFLMCVPGCGDDGGEGGLGGLGTIGGGDGTTAVVYVTNNGSNTVSGYSINPSTGGLTVIPGSPFANVSAPSAMVVSSNGFFAYAANSQTNNVAAFRVGTNGALLFGVSTPVGTTPRALAISRDSRFLYVANSGSDSVTAFNIGTAGVLTRIPPTAGNPNPASAGGSAPVAVTISPAGRFLYVANRADNTVMAFQIETSGLLTQVPPAGPGSNPISVSGTGPTGLAMSSNGQFLYVTNGASNNVTAFQVEPSGLLTLVPTTGPNPNPVPTGGATPNGIAVAPNGAYLYIANEEGNVSAFAIGGNGLLTLVPSSGNTLNPAPTGASPAAVTVSQDGQFLYVANRGGSVSAYTIVSGSGTVVPLTPLLGNPFPAGTSPSAIATPGRI
ncbi:MAG: beta-propeller fold lactonase family protein [Nitrospira sp.]